MQWWALELGPSHRNLNCCRKVKHFMRIRRHLMGNGIEGWGWWCNDLRLRRGFLLLCICTYVQSVHITVSVANLESHYTGIVGNYYVGCTCRRPGKRQHSGNRGPGKHEPRQLLQQGPHIHDHSFPRSLNQARLIGWTGSTISRRLLRWTVGTMPPNLRGCRSILPGRVETISCRCQKKLCYGERDPPQTVQTR